MVQVRQIKPEGGLPPVSGKVAGFSFVPQVRRPQAPAGALRPLPPLESIGAAGALGGAIAKVGAQIAAIAIEANARNKVLKGGIRLSKAKQEFNDKADIFVRKARNDTREDIEQFLPTVEKGLDDLQNEVVQNFKFTDSFNEAKFRAHARDVTNGHKSNTRNEEHRHNVAEFFAIKDKEEEEGVRLLQEGVKPIDTIFQGYVDLITEKGFRGGALDQNQAGDEISRHAKVLRLSNAEIKLRENPVLFLEAAEGGGLNVEKEKILNLTPLELGTFIDRAKSLIRQRSNAIKSQLTDLKGAQVSAQAETGQSIPQWDNLISELAKLDLDEAQKIQKESDFANQLFRGKVNVWNLNQEDGKKFVDQVKGEVVLGPKFDTLTKRAEFVQKSFNAKWVLRQSDPADWADNFVAHGILEMQSKTGDEVSPLDIQRTTPEEREAVLRIHGGPGPILTQTKTEMEAFLTQLNQAPVEQQGEILNVKRDELGDERFSNMWANVDNRKVPASIEFLANLSLLGREGAIQVGGIALNIIQRTQGKKLSELKAAVEKGSKITDKATVLYNTNVMPAFSHIIDHDKRRELLQRMALGAKALNPELSEDAAVKFAFENSYGVLFETHHVGLFGEFRIPVVRGATPIFASRLKTPLVTAVPKRVLNGGQFVKFDVSMVRKYVGAWFKSNAVKTIFASMNAVDRADLLSNGTLRITSDGNGYNIVDGRGINVEFNDAPIRIEMDDIINFNRGLNVQKEQFFQIWKDRVSEAGKLFRDIRSISTPLIGIR